MNTQQTIAQKMLRLTRLRIELAALTRDLRGYCESCFCPSTTLTKSSFSDENFCAECAATFEVNENDN